jgi:hypothetical protein
MRRETGGLLEGLRPEARDFLQLGAGLERALLIAPCHDGSRDRGVQAGDVAEQLLRGGIHLDTDAVDRADHGIVE